MFFFFFNDTATTEIYTLSLHDALPISDTLRRLVQRAEKDNLDLVSLMVLAQVNSLPERLLIPPFLYFFLKLYPPSWTAGRRRKTAGASAGSILVEPAGLERSG